MSRRMRGVGMAVPATLLLKELRPQWSTSEISKLSSLSTINLSDVNNRANSIRLQGTSLDLTLLGFSFNTIKKVLFLEAARHCSQCCALMSPCPPGHTPHKRISIIVLCSEKIKILLTLQHCQADILLVYRIT